MKKTLILLGMVAALLVSCKDKNNNDDNGEKAREQARLDSINANIKADNLIYELLSDYYLWNSKMPRYQKGENRFPGDYFKSLLYKELDRWSFCVEDGASYLAESEGTPYSMGYEPEFWPYNNYENVLIVVEFVYPGSPADRAGLKRGDIIIEIDGEPMTIDNYYDLYSKEHATYTLAGYDPVKNELYLTGRRMTMQAEIVDADPSIYDTIINVGGKPVGYYVYTAFTRNDNYTATMDAIFDRFKAAGVKDLILDLRYNGGGDVPTAGHLASAIAPANVVGKEVLIKYEYNSLLTNYYKKNDPENLEYKFPKNDHNADMQKRMFEVLGIGPEEAEYKFGFIINAFKFGAPPHGGLAFGFDRVCALMGGQDTIRDYIAFPKNNQGRDVMIDSPSEIDQTQLDELQIALNLKSE